MKKKLPITKNKDVVVSWVYTWSKQQDMSIHEQRIVLRILEACQAELKGVKLKDYAGTKRKFEHGLWDVDAQMHVSDVIFSGRDYNEIIAALDSLAGRFFTYEDDEEWWKCGFISNPKYKKRTGIITFRVSNDLWDVFTKFAKGYREFELNKALALPTGYSLRFYMLMSGQVYPLDISLENLKDRLGIPADKYKDKNGKDRIDHFEERVLKPAKAALDESCPYTFNYVKVRENPNNKRSKVTGFRFYPVYQPQFRDEELEGKELQAKVTARYQIDSHVYEYLRYSCGFPGSPLPCVHGHHAAAHLGGHHDIISGELLRKLFQILSLCGQGLHLRNAGAGQALGKGALAAVQRPGDKDHNSPPHWQAHSAASIHSSAFCKNHPARSPVMPPNCLSETT